MWYDATSAVGTIEDPASSKVAGKNGYAWAPTQDGRPSGWLYTWSLAIPKTSAHKQAAWDFISWMTSKTYIKTVGQKLGWSHVPPGSRFSSYQIPQYKKLSAVYGPLTLQSINATNSAHPCLKPVPYTGVQFLDIPEFQDLGTNVSEQFSAAIAGQSVGRARAGPGAEVRPGRRRNLPGSEGPTMTAIAPPVAGTPPAHGRSDERRAGAGCGGLRCCRRWCSRSSSPSCRSWSRCTTRWSPWSLVRPGSRHFVGFANYAQVFQDSQFRHDRAEHGDHDASASCSSRWSSGCCSRCCSTASSSAAAWCARC